MTSNYSTVSRMFKKVPKAQYESSGSSSKLWFKKSLQIECETKDLRETGSTLNSTPKHQKKINPTDFEFIRSLGNGKFGSVYLVRHFETGFIFALKIINKSHMQSESSE